MEGDEIYEFSPSDVILSTNEIKLYKEIEEKRKAISNIHSNFLGEK